MYTPTWIKTITTKLAQYKTRHAETAKMETTVHKQMV